MQNFVRELKLKWYHYHTKLKYACKDYYKIFNLYIYITVPNGTDYWMDSTKYEIFILTNQTINANIREISFISSEAFRTNHGTLVDLVDEIRFTLSGTCPYFYFYFDDILTMKVKLVKQQATFKNYYDFYIPDDIETVILTLARPVPADDYMMQVTVTNSGNELEKRDIVIHVREVPPCVTTPGLY